MIILTEEQKDNFLKIKESIQEELESQGADYIPIETKVGWCLPDEILSDIRFEKLKNILEEKGEFDKYEKREIDVKELIEYSRPDEKIEVKK